jgi:predicted nucleic-acid-binding Zn-ribbon protein
MPNEIKCPKCGSTQIHSGKRGWKLTTGFLGSSSIVMTCLKCGHKFKPGQGK